MDDEDDALSSVVSAGLGDVAISPLLRPPLLGRDVESKTLESVWERVSSDCQSEVVTVRGPSGVGKSYLIESFRPIVMEGTKQGIFVSSKFDQHAFEQNSRREPFYAVVSAFSDICEILMAKESGSEIGEEVRQAVGGGAEFRRLCQFIPTLHQLVSLASIQEEIDPQTDDFRLGVTAVNTDDSLARVCWAATTFLNVVSASHPIFLHFDDVHWADTESTNLIQALVTDIGSRSIVIALSFREGVDSSNVMSSMLNLRTTSVTFGGEDDDDGANPVVTTTTSSDCIPTTDIVIKGLSKKGVKKLMKAILRLYRLASVDSKSTCQLTKLDQNEEQQQQHPSDEIVNLVYAKTSGKPLFVLQFLERLKLGGLLRCSAWGWVWGDVETMTRLAVVSEDLLGSIEARVSQLQEETRVALTVAAHLGFRFKRDVLDAVLAEEYETHSNDDLPLSPKQRVDRVLDSAERASLLLRLNSGESFCFMHEHIRHYLYELIEPGDLKRKLYLDLGSRLVPMLEKDDSLYYLVADLLNNGSDLIVDKDKRFELVQINKTAADMSLRRAAYRSATHYLKCAIHFLDSKRMWKDTYDITLSLHSNLALASCNCSEYAVCHRTAKTIARKARCVAHKHTSTLASIHAFTLEGKFQESIEKGLKALSELGVRIKARPSKAYLMLRLVRMKGRVLSTPISRMMSPPKMSDPNKLAILEIIGEMNASIFISANQALSLHLYELMMASSLRVGWSSSTTLATASFGLVEIGAFGNVRRGAELGSLALDMLSCYETEEHKCPVTLTTNSFLFPWTRAWRDCSYCLSDGFSSGLAHGKTFAALNCLVTNSGFARITESLPEAARIIKTNFETMKRFKASSVLLPLSNCYFQFVLNMMGCADNPLKLCGELVDEGDPLFSNNPLTKAISHLLQFELACHFGALDRAWLLLKDLKQEVERFKLICPCMVLFWFWTGMLYLDVSYGDEPGKRRSLLWQAQGCLERLQRTVRDGCEDARPFCEILEAEIRSCFGSSNDYKMLMYDLAIQTAARHGYVGYAGVASERAYLCSERLGIKDVTTSQRYFHQMMRYYEQWGAIAKMEWVTRTHGHKLLEQKQEVVKEIVVNQLTSKASCVDTQYSSTASAMF